MQGPGCRQHRRPGCPPATTLSSLRQGKKDPKCQAWARGGCVTCTHIALARVSPMVPPNSWGTRKQSSALISITVARNEHKPNGLKQHTCIRSQFRESEVPDEPQGLKPSCRRGRLLWEAHRYLHSLADGLFPVFNAGRVAVPLLSDLLPLSWLDLCVHLEIQDNFPTLKSVPESHHVR